MKISVGDLVFKPEEAAALVHQGNWNAIQNQVLCLVADWQSDKQSFQLKSSGSTGVPKEIELSRTFIEWSASNTKKQLHLGDDLKVLCALPLDKAGGFMMLMRCLIFHWDLQVVEPVANPLDNLKIMPNFISLVPYQVNAMLANNLSTELLKQIDTILLGGASIHAKSEKILASWTNQICIGYGMTETAGHIALRALSQKSDDKGYKPFEGVILNAKEGTIEIDIPAFGMHFVTSDLGKIHQGKLYLEGRKEFFLNSGGLKISSHELEEKLQQVLLAMDLHREIAIIALPHEDLGDSIVAVIEGASFGEEELKNIKKELRNLVHNKLLPRKWYFIDIMPRINFKTDRNALVKKFSAGI